jgi:hypothetical protein
MIFVFGSNLAGRHGEGAAKAAVEKHGAKMGQGIGLQGNSYAIPTKDYSLRTLDIETIRRHIKTFIEFARAHEDLDFYITAVGTGLARYKHKEIAPLFLGIPPSRCSFPAEWQTYLGIPYTFRPEGHTL